MWQNRVRAASHIKGAALYVINLEKLKGEVSFYCHRVLGGSRDRYIDPKE
ncbi:MAG: hypothetical protein SOX61_04760 [Prevotella sp.]|nr:hypothetical protein [Prevotella sp.]MDY3252334.1 hypothetical protein [Prevotella sp.]